MDKCPKCGYCPHCGRSNAYGFYPYMPYTTYPLVWPYGGAVYGSSTVRTTNIPINTTVSGTTYSMPSDAIISYTAAA